MICHLLFLLLLYHQYHATLYHQMQQVDNGNYDMSVFRAGNVTWGERVFEYYCVDKSQDMNTMARLLLQGAFAFRWIQSTDFTLLWKHKRMNWEDHACNWNWINSPQFLHILIFAIKFLPYFLKFNIIFLISLLSLFPDILVLVS